MVKFGLKIFSKFSAGPGWATGQYGPPWPAPAVYPGFTLCARALVANIGPCVWRGAHVHYGHWRCGQHGPRAKEHGARSAGHTAWPPCAPDTLAGDGPGAIAPSSLGATRAAATFQKTIVQHIYRSRATEIRVVQNPTATIGSTD
jgi:hypothetical protein